MTHQERTSRRRRMADLVHNGLTLGEVAGQFGVSMTMVRMAYEEFHPGEKAKKGRPRASSTVRILALLIKTPLTLQEIADRVGVKYQRVQELQMELQGVGLVRDNAFVKNS
jgi:transposase